MAKKNNLGKGIVIGAIGMIILSRLSKSNNYYSDSDDLIWCEGPGWKSSGKRLIITNLEEARKSMFLQDDILSGFNCLGDLSTSSKDLDKYYDLYMHNLIGKNIPKGDKIDETVLYIQNKLSDLAQKIKTKNIIVKVPTKDEIITIVNKYYS